MPRKVHSTSWIDKAIALEEKVDRRRIISAWVKCAICDRVKLPRKKYRELGLELVCPACVERHKNAKPGVGLDTNHMVGHR